MMNAPALDDVLFITHTHNAGIVISHLSARWPRNGSRRGGGHRGGHRYAKSRDSCPPHVLRGRVSRDTIVSLRVCAARVCV